jgi:hypothetical protein
MDEGWLEDKLRIAADLGLIGLLVSALFSRQLR